LIGVLFELAAGVVIEALTVGALVELVIPLVPWLQPVKATTAPNIDMTPRRDIFLANIVKAPSMDNGSF
jgi:hypothetical protein